MEKHTKTIDFVAQQAAQTINEVLESALAETHSENDRTAIVSEFEHRLKQTLMSSHLMADLLEQGDLIQNGRPNTLGMLDVLYEYANTIGDPHQSKRLQHLATSMKATFQSLRMQPRKAPNHA